jgi:hypothetical protein
MLSDTLGFITAAAAAAEHAERIGVRAKVLLLRCGEDGRLLLCVWLSGGWTS